MGHGRDFRARNIELVDPERVSPSVLIARRFAFLTSATNSMYGLSEVSSNHSATSSRSTAGANGRKLSRYLTFRLRIFCMSGDRGSPRIERAPRERGPNSIRP